MLTMNISNKDGFVIAVDIKKLMTLVRELELDGHLHHDCLAITVDVTVQRTGVSIGHALCSFADSVDTIKNGRCFLDDRINAQAGRAIAINRSTIHDGKAEQGRLYEFAGEK